MRIVIDLQGAQSSGSRTRGIGRYTISLAKAIIRNKGEHEIIIVLSGLFPETIEPIRAEFTDLVSQDKILVWQAIGPVTHLDSNNNLRRKSAELIREAFFASLHPDIVYVTSLFEGLTDDAVTSVGLFTSQIPIAVTLYDLIPLINKNPYLENPVVEKWYNEKIEYLKQADLLLSISESSRQEGIEYLGFSNESVINISTAADPQFKLIQINKDKENTVRKNYSLSRPFVLYTGGIDHRKNIEGLIRSFALLSDSLRHKYQLAIVCSINDDARDKLKALAKQQGIGDNELVLTGFVPEDDLIALYHLCEIFIFPSWHEGFGLPALEAMSCGAPTIASNTSSLPEVVGWSEAMFDPMDDKSISEKLTQGLTDESFRSELIRHGLEQSKKFSWDESARKAIQALEKLYETRIRRQLIPPTFSRRPKLAYISPLPPCRSGIADYSAELLPVLAFYYDIDVIIADDKVTDVWINQNCAIRDVDWFLTHKNRFDRVLYHFGNSEFHQHMFDLLKTVPGVVVLHDFFLSGILAHLELSGAKQNIWTNNLYYSHGYEAVQMRYHSDDVANAIWEYPCNRLVVDNTLGVIVHSENSRRLANYWLCKSYSHDWEVIPHLRVPSSLDGRITARHELGIPENAFLVCSFGLLSPTKQNQRLLDAWLASRLASDPQCYLIFVGENHSGSYGQEILMTIQRSGLTNRIQITGWAETECFRLYLAAADLGVQLRCLSRGETSGTVLDCMNYGLATIVNANGSMADLPKEAVWMLPDEFNESDLIEALETLRFDEGKRNLLSKTAREVILSKHAPKSCAEQYFNIIEQFYSPSFSQKKKDDLIKAIATLPDLPKSDDELLSLAKVIDQNYSPLIENQLLIDISELVRTDAQTGIQRVVRSILKELLLNPPKGFRVEPVFANQNVSGYRYARKFTLKFLDCPDDMFVDDPVVVKNGDIFIGLDLQQAIVEFQKEVYQYWRRLGVHVYFVIYDLIPVLNRQAYPSYSAEIHTEWLKVVAQCDGGLCISRAVADEMAEWLTVSGVQRSRPFNLGWFHLGADLANSVPSKGMPSDIDHVSCVIASRPTFLMVGTLEPRKGYLQTLKAFEELWSEGLDVNLIIVGKEPWKDLPSALRCTVPLIVSNLLFHSELNRRLFWFENVSDEFVDSLYASSNCLVIPSEAEGFGLPIIEAAWHNLPVIARDIPVFREIAGDNIMYFTGLLPDDLATSIRDWMKLSSFDKAPKSGEISTITWQSSTNNLIALVSGSKFYKQWLPDKVFRIWGGDSRLHTQVGNRLGREIATTYQAGFLLYGPYVEFLAGNYTVIIHGEIFENSPEGFWIDVAVNRGNTHLGKFFVNEVTKKGYLCSLPISLDMGCTDLEVRAWVDSTTVMYISLIEIFPSNF